MPNLKHGLSPTTQVIWRSTGNPGMCSRELLAVQRNITGTKWSQTIRARTQEMWAGRRTITDNKRKTSSAEIMSAFLPDELNTFYAHFEKNFPAEEVQKAQEACPSVISRADVCKSFSRINPCKVPELAKPSRCVQINWQIPFHFQHVTAPVCSPHMLEEVHHCPCPPKRPKPSA